MTNQKLIDRIEEILKKPLLSKIHNGSQTEEEIKKILSEELNLDQQYEFFTSFFNNFQEVKHDSKWQITNGIQYLDYRLSEFDYDMQTNGFKIGEIESQDYIGWGIYIYSLLGKYDQLIRYIERTENIDISDQMKKYHDLKSKLYGFQLYEDFRLWRNIFAHEYLNPQTIFYTHAFVYVAMLIIIYFTIKFNEIFT